MKKLLAYLLFSLIFFSCKKEYTDSPNLPKGALLAIFKVDNITHEFQGAKVYNFPARTFVTDSIPVSYHYFINNNFGDITLFYTPTKDTVFDGHILWTSDGNVRFPTLDDPALYSSQNFTAYPDSLSVQQISWAAPNYNPINIPAIWTGVEFLDITHKLVSMNARIGLFAYTPNATTSALPERQWFWVMYALNP